VAASRGGHRNRINGIENGGIEKPAANNGNGEISGKYDNNGVISWHNGQRRGGISSYMA
jgi:hypothetical protein